MHSLLGGIMKSLLLLLSLAVLASGCTTSTSPANKDLSAEGTLGLCRIVYESKDVETKNKAVILLIKRGANPEKCVRLIQSDKNLATGIAISAGAVAAGAVIANNGGYGGGYYPQTSPYGVAWDQFYNQYNQLIWRCRDKATGRFVDDYHCAAIPKADSTWRGW